jgi:Bacterial Ig-like domain (group 3)/BNR repeat-like domain
MPRRLAAPHAEPFRPGASTLLAVLLLGGLPSLATAQIPGENVNMVSGTTWPGGDPFLQRQNEPSIAVSAANPLHLLAGANDYRSVDLSVVVAKMPGDAWLGVFKSFDGGQTWRSTLMPGSPMDDTPEGQASPLKGYTAAADPVIRAGPAGMLYYSGIAFNRDTNLGQVFVARFFDGNDKENGDVVLGLDPIRYLDAVTIATGTSGQFLDKPWLAVDVARPGGPTCFLPGTGGRTVPTGAVYLTYATFTGSNEQSSKIMITRSLDCGRTWSSPQKVSESNSVNQGTVMAIDPVSGAIHVAWRRFAGSSEGNAILAARSTDGGRSFTKGQVVADIVPFDQGTGSARIRVQTLPALAVSVNTAGTQSWVHLAWVQRSASGADARVVLSTSADGTGWSAPVPVDDGPLADDFGNGFSRGHQLMPALSFSQGRLLVLYYDSRFSHTRSYYQPNSPFVPDAMGRFYAEYLAPRGELVWNPALVHGGELDDAPFTEIRHTLDVRVAQSTGGPAPAFTSARVSQFRFGTRGDEPVGQTAPGFGETLQVVDAQGNVQLLQQLQVNPPNLPLFKGGTVPFLGDYIDIAGPAFVPTPGGGWAFATAPALAPVHYAVWATNQDVRPPADGDWTHYTPVGAAGPSFFDPTVGRPACLPGQEGMRNQNIYSARITDGLLVSSPQNVKPLSPTLTRAFVVAVANATDGARAIRLSVAPPAGVAASFRNDGQVLQSFDVVIPARSAIARSLFVRLDGATDPASTLIVNAAEVSNDPACLGALPPTCPLVFGGLAGSVTLNPPGAVPGLQQPDGSDVDVDVLEVYPPGAGAANVTSANVTSTTLTGAANVTSANVTSANVTSANVTSTHISNPDLANVTSANVTSANVTSANVTSANVTSAAIAANVTSANVTSANVTSAAISDASYTVTNDGNTTHSYHVRIVGSVPAGTPLQLILAKPYAVPLALGCTLYEEPRAQVVSNVDDVASAVVPPGTDLADPNIPDPRATNATFSLAPGESLQVTVRGALSTAQMTELTTRLVPAVVPHAGGGYAAPLLVTSDGSSLPLPQVGVFYTVTLQAIGGAPPYRWALDPSSGPLPDGLSLTSLGVLAGTPTVAGSTTFTVLVTDSASQPGSAPRAITLTVVAGPTTTALAVAPSPSSAFQPVVLAATVWPAATGLPPPTGSVTFLDGGVPIQTVPLQGGSASLTVGSLSVGGHALRVAYAGATSYQASLSAVTAHQVNPGPVAVTLLASPDLPVFGQPVSLTATVARNPAWPGAPVPTGTVTFFDGPEPLGQAVLAGGQASLQVSGLGTGGHVFVATSSGDATSAPGTSAGQPLVVDLAATATSLASSLNPSTSGQAVTFTAAIQVVAPGSGAVAGTVTFLDGATVIGSGTISGGIATLTTAGLAVGTHPITARYAGGVGLAGSTSPAVSQVVKNPFYAFTGFFTPLSAAGTLASPTLSPPQNYGSGLPIKWQLRDAGGAMVSRLSSTMLLKAVRNAACGGPAPSGAPEVVLYSPTGGAAGGSTFRFSTDQFVFNWDTSKGASKGCWEIVLQLDDGSPPRATIVKLR